MRQYGFGYAPENARVFGRFKAIKQRQQFWKAMFKPEDVRTLIENYGEQVSEEELARHQA